jgi:hypothetical protein
MKKGKRNKRLKLLMQGIPLVAAVGASMLPIRQVAHQFLMLITLVWIQVFFIMDCFSAGKR